MDLALPFTDTPEEAQRLATIALEKNRSQITITGSFGLGAFGLQVGDNVNITNTRFGWTDKLFEVVAWSLSLEDYQLSVNLVLRETTDTTYDEELNTTGFESDNTNLPGALGEVVVGGGVTGTDDVTGLTAEGGIRTINATWTNPVNDSYGFTRIYYNTSASWNIGQYVDVVGESHSFSVNPNVTYYLLAQAYDNAGTPADLGTMFPSSGFISATSKRSDTADVINNAITNSQSGELSSNTNIAGPFATTTIAQTAQFTATGENVLVSWDALISETFSGDPRIRFDLKRSQSGNSDNVQTFNNVVVALRETYSGSYLDEDCNAGSVRYELVAECQTSGSGDMTAEAAHISATEVKR